MVLRVPGIALHHTSYDVWAESQISKSMKYLHVCSQCRTSNTVVHAIYIKQASTQWTVPGTSTTGSTGILFGINDYGIRTATASSMMSTVFGTIINHQFARHNGADHGNRANGAASMIRVEMQTLLLVVEEFSVYSTQASAMIPF